MQSNKWQNVVNEELGKVTDIFKRYPWEDKEAYSDFISNMYYFLSQACRLLASAASECDTSLDIFHHRFIQHAAEEKNHEKLVLNDLRALKEELRPCLKSMPPIWQTQYYMIQHNSPLALLGCILYLENLSLNPGIGPATYERCKITYGDKCTSYLRVHVLEDDSHVGKLFAVLESLPESQAEIVMESLLITSTLYKNFLTELIEKQMSRMKTLKAS